MKRTVFLVVFLLCVPAFSAAQRCDSYSASINGDWKRIATAPRDGTKVEILQTYGVAPWYDLFYWRKKGTKYVQTVHYSIDGKSAGDRQETFVETKGSWASADRPGHSVIESSCLFWRPYKGPDEYVDPTGGAQNSVAYWCAAEHLQYDPKKDVCVKPR